MCFLINFLFDDLSIGVSGVLKSPTIIGLLSISPFMSVSVCLQRRQWHPTPVLLPGKFHGLRSLVRYSPWGHKKLDMTERLHFHFHTPLTPMDRLSKQKINKETHVLNDTLDEMDLIDIFRTFHPNAE